MVISSRQPDLIFRWHAHPLLSGLSGETRERLAAQAAFLRASANRIIGEVGEPLTSVTFLLSGTVRCFASTPHGREATLRLVSAPMILGAAEAVSGVSANAVLETVERADLAALPVASYSELLGSSGAFMRRHLELMADLLVHASHVQAVTAAPLEVRLADLLLSYGDLFGAVRDKMLCVTQPLTQLGLARMVGAVRRSVTNVFARWRRAGIVEQEDGRIAFCRAAMSSICGRSRGSLVYWIGMPPADVVETGELADLGVAAEGIARPPSPAA